MKVVTEQHYCDRCKAQIKRECVTIVEGLAYTVSTYDPRGSGGGNRHSLELCETCSREFLEWMDRKSTPKVI